MSAPGIHSAAADIEVLRRADGSTVLRSRTELRAGPRSLGDLLRWWAATAPDRVLVSEPGPEGGRREVTFAEAASAAAALGQAYLDLGLGSAAPLLVLSGNSVDHLLLTLAGYLVGVPVVPVSAAHSLRSTDHARVRGIAELVRPGLVFADDGERYSAALAALGRFRQAVVAHPRPGQSRLSDLLATTPTERVERALDATRPETVAKIMFTSGSTGTPKGVITTHGMLNANQQMLHQIWPALRYEPPVLTDWLPWSHTFGGSHNVNLALYNGGSLHIDHGRPAPGEFDSSVQALLEHPPTILVNVPAGYAMLIDRLERDPDAAARILSRVSIVLVAGAELAAAQRDRLVKIIAAATDRTVDFVNSWGATETAPLATSTYGGVRAGIGIPVPGVEIKLVPISAGRFEIRVGGPIVTPGYIGDRTRTGFDEEGCYRAGDAVRLIDPKNPGRGMVYDGRLSEDFKLDTGTWVNSGELCRRLLTTTGLLSDAVIVGEGRSYLTAIAWLAPGTSVPDTAAGAPHHALPGDLAREIACALAELNSGKGSAARVERLVVAAEPPSLDHGEITDKGYINRRAVVTRRTDLIAALYEDTAPAGIVTAAVEPITDGTAAPA